jgi:hypothetical protein
MGFSGLNMASVTLCRNMTMQETGQEGQFVVTGPPDAGRSCP